MTINLHKITNKSWIASTDGTPVALIHQGVQFFTYMTPDTSMSFNTMEDIKVYLGGKVNEQISDASGIDSKVENEIDGFPVKHDTITVECGGSRPVYCRGGGKTQHVAGYWTIKFSKRWVPAFCPMLKTTEQYQSNGPFKTRLEMMNAMLSLNRQA